MTPPAISGHLVSHSYLARHLLPRDSQPLDAAFDKAVAQTWSSACARLGPASNVRAIPATSPFSQAPSIAANCARSREPHR